MEPKIDDPIWVKVGTGEWQPRHFACFSGSKKPMCWSSGGTSHTTNLKSVWDEWSNKNPYAWVKPA